jgi:hypothetical protein
MKKLSILLAIVIFAIVGCGHNDPSNNGNAPAVTAVDANTLTAIEQEAALQGVSIRHESSEYSSRYNGTVNPLTVSWGGVGYTSEELLSAVQILRKYHAAVTSSTSILQSSDRKQQLDVINDAMTSIQSKRNDILSKKICGNNNNN